jgi:pimeloyl-ACP methyl ester carboxylesterase
VGIPASYGSLVDIGERSLCARLRGTGDVTVVFENGAGSPSSVWTAVERLLADEFRTLTYDRAGLGLSPPGPLPRTGDAVAADLARLLDALSIDRCILVAHSAGGLYARLLQAHHPTVVSALVFVDAVDGYTYDEVKAHLKPYERVVQKALSIGMRLADGLGLVAVFARLQPASRDVKDDPGLIEARDLTWRGRNVLAGSRAEGAELPAIAKAVAALGDLGDLPVRVVSAGEHRGTFARVAGPWTAAQERLAGLSRNSCHVLAEGAGHFVQTARPDVIADAVRAVAAQL